MDAVTLSVLSPLPREPRAGVMDRFALIIGLVFYIAGSAVYIGLTVSFFVFRVYDTTSESRVISISIFAGMFYAIQGLIAILVVRGGEAHRRHDEYLIGQMRALSFHGFPPPDPSHIPADPAHPPADPRD